MGVGDGFDDCQAEADGRRLSSSCLSSTVNYRYRRHRADRAPAAGGNGCQRECP
jgi:hypothetical protein